MVAVYTVEAANVPVTAGAHVTVPVYWSLVPIVVTGVPPVAGLVTPGIAFKLITVLVAGNTAVTTTLAAVPAVLVTVVASATVKPKLAATPSVV